MAPVAKILAEALHEGGRAEEAVLKAGRKVRSFRRLSADDLKAKTGRLAKIFHGGPHDLSTGFDMSKLGETTVPNLNSLIGANFISDPVAASIYAGKASDAGQLGRVFQMSMPRTSEHLALGSSEEFFGMFHDFMQGETKVPFPGFADPEKYFPNPGDVTRFRQNLLDKGVSSISFPHGGKSIKDPYSALQYLMLDPNKSPITEYDFRAAGQAAEAKRGGWSSYLQQRKSMEGRLEKERGVRDRIARVTEKHNATPDLSSDVRARARILENQWMKANPDDPFGAPNFSTQAHSEVVASRKASTARSSAPRRRVNMRRRPSVARTGLRMRGSGPDTGAIANLTEGKKVWLGG
jgi:hypothetical protein